jgi:hypothetical protein
LKLIPYKYQRFSRPGLFCVISGRNIKYPVIIKLLGGRIEKSSIK